MHGAPVAGGRPLAPPAEDIALAMMHGGVFIVVGTTMFNIASRQVPAVAMAVFAQTETLFVPIWALLVLGERPSTQSLFGGDDHLRRRGRQGADRRPSRT